MQHAPWPTSSTPLAAHAPSSNSFLCAAAVVALCLAVAPSLLAAQAVSLDQVRSLRCETRRSVTTTWDRGVPAPRVSAAPSLAPLVFDAIDREAARARLIGHAGAADVTVIVDDDGLQFVEKTEMLSHPLNSGRNFT